MYKESKELHENKRKTSVVTTNFKFLVKNQCVKLFLGGNFR